MSVTDWRKAGRDAAHEDATCEDAIPCTTLDGARERCAAWLEDAEGADAEAAAEGYLAGWAAHLRDAAESAAPLDLDAIEARARDNADFCTYRLARKSAADVPAREASGASLRATARACGRSDAWLSRVENGHEAPSEEALRTLADRLRVDDAATLDRWCALAGIVPARMARALLAAPDRWAAVRRVLGRARP